MGKEKMKDKMFAKISNRTPKSIDYEADKFEYDLINYLEKKYGLVFIEMCGTNSYYFRGYVLRHVFEFSIIGRQKNTSTPSLSQEWLLRVEESKPFFLIPIVLQLFNQNNIVTRNMGKGTIRIQLRSQDFIGFSAAERQSNLKISIVFRINYLYLQLKKIVFK